MNCGLFSIFFSPRFLVQQRLLMTGFKFLVKMTSKKLFNNFIRYVFVDMDFILSVDANHLPLIFPGSSTISSSEVKIWCRKRLTSKKGDDTQSWHVSDAKTVLQGVTAEGSWSGQWWWRTQTSVEHSNAIAQMLQPPLSLPGCRAGSPLYHRRSPCNKCR